LLQDLELRGKILKGKNLRMKVSRSDKKQIKKLEVTKPRFYQA
jgi:hypothetical protein